MLALIDNVGHFVPCYIPALSTNDRLHSDVINSQCAPLWFECQEGERKCYERRTPKCCVDNRRPRPGSQRGCEARNEKTLLEVLAT